ncbi:hypothetical protein XENOCAPTIV_028342 [Xenoophorus captivus]|uniref:Uncharacterized protein n=1 Tax=Xenoophorus captivus TaxID=1517983 RepID=A0ABV0RAK6_9TELE
MSTRPKRGPVPECDIEKSHDAGDQQGAVSGSDDGQGNVAELTRVLQSLMQQQAERDAKLEQEYKRQEDRWRHIRHQFAQLQQQVQHGTHQQSSEVPVSTSAGRGPDSEPSHSPQYPDRLDSDPVL